MKEKILTATILAFMLISLVLVFQAAPVSVSPSENSVYGSVEFQIEGNDTATWEE